MPVAMMRYLTGALLAVCIHVSTVYPGISIAGDNLNAKIAIHVATLKSKSQMCGLPRPPCNVGTSNLTVEAAVPGNFRLYLLALDGDAEAGIGSVQFGIAYGPGVQVTNWMGCGGLDFPSSAPNSVWPDSASSNVVTWDHATNCQNAPATGDLDDGVTAIIGVLDVAVETPSCFSITPRRVSGREEAVLVADCDRRQSLVKYPLATGRVVFGSYPESSLDPCKGPFSPFSTFLGLSASELSTLEIRVASVVPGGKGPVVILQGSAAVAEYEMFAPYRRIDVSYSGEEGGLVRRELSVAEMGAVLDSLATVAEFDENPNSDPFTWHLSITTLSTYGGGNRAYEGIVNTKVGRELVEKMRGAIENNPSAVRSFDQVTCNTGLCR